ncbi:MAG TPA: hydantoinase/oxoprolinase family protein [Rhodothermales bacterium]|nr:hydantoinase/oxoprolinase family protein [Rhodothermales bacterium]
MMKLGIDIGGTFTDLVLLDEASGRMVFAKTLTTYPDPSLGILNGVQQILQNAAVSLADVQTIVHGTTLVTNAVIERKGAKTALLTTKGFEDVLEIGREMRYDIYDIHLTMPQPLVSRALRVGIAERLDKNGHVLQGIETADLKAALTKLQKKGVQSVAVCFLHAYANPKHEQIVGEVIRKQFPALRYSLSSETMPEIREYERCSATAMNAYVQPLMDTYLQTLQAKLADLGFMGVIHIMDSAGRLTTLEGARKNPVQLLESGPAGGAMASVFFAAQLGQTQNTLPPDLVAFDMGGTTAKASIIRNGQPEITNHFEAAREKRFKKGSGLPVRIPVIDLIEIGAGGGSIAHLNALGLLSVGPESAASTPGPACYNRGGKNPTVTDADLVLGYLNENYFLGGTMTLRKDLATQAIREKIAEPLGISVEEAAWGIHRIVNENMANAARVHILEKGLDPRHFSMMAFGGAGPVHAFHVARLMSAPALFVPSGAGVLSALGFLVSPIATEEMGSYVSRLTGLNWDKVNKMLAAMREKGVAFLQNAGIAPETATAKLTIDMRYVGQGHEIAVSIPFGELSAHAIPLIEQSFKTEYLLRYGRSIDHIPIETVTWRVLVSGPKPALQPHQKVMGKSKKVRKGHRAVFWGESFEETPVYDRYQMPIGQPFEGPCIIEEFESTTVVGKNSTVTIDAFKNITIQLKEG